MFGLDLEYEDVLNNVNFATVAAAGAGERRVAQLLEAAGAEMAEVGYEATTMTAIAERAGASIGTLYQYFRTRMRWRWRCGRSMSRSLRSAGRHLRAWCEVEFEAACGPDRGHDCRLHCAASGVSAFDDDVAESQADHGARNRLRSISRRCFGASA